MEIYRFDSIPSTNTALAQLSKKGAKSWTVIWTSNQTQGRGYAGNEWKTEKGMNLAFSVLINSQLNHPELIYFNQWVCNIIHRYLSRFSNEVFIKWPNDIIVRNKKVCGILIETHKSDNQLNIISGVGLNVNQKDYSRLPKAGSLLTQTGKEYDLEEILSGLLTEMENSYHQIENEEWEEISLNYNRYLFRKDEIRSFKTNDEIFNGIIKQVNHSGFLVLELENGRVKTYQHKEIELLY